AKTTINKPLVSTVHSTEYDRAPYPWEFILNIERIGLKAADRVITVSNRMRSQLVERFGADESKIRVIYNGVDATRFAQRMPGETRGKRVLFLGRLTDQKGPVQFLHAAKKVVEKEPEVRFIMAGDGPMLSYLISLSIQLGLQNNVVFTGYLPEEQLRRAYSMCDVYVMPSISEPFGITALEAMASGTPIIVSKSSGVAEITNHCLKVDFWDIDEMANKMIALLRYEPLGSEMSRSGLAEVRNFTWERTAEQTIGVYRELVGDK
ncbi:MAG: glycosyltransferase family 4 protein, partial [Candidatus Micrarchaeota archaeon]